VGPISEKPVLFTEIGTVHQKNGAKIIFDHLRFFPLCRIFEHYLGGRRFLSTHGFFLPVFSFQLCRSVLPAARFSCSSRILGFFWAWSCGIFTQPDSLVQRFSFPAWFFVGFFHQGRSFFGSLCSCSPVDLLTTVVSSAPASQAPPCPLASRLIFVLSSTRPRQRLCVDSACCRSLCGPPWWLLGSCTASVR
jgi:hypothetical protein